MVVLARNHYGWSDSSKILRFATGGEGKSLHPFFSVQSSVCRSVLMSECVRPYLISVEFPNYSTESDKYGVGGGISGADDLANDAKVDDVDVNDVDNDDDGSDHNDVGDSNGQITTTNDITENSLVAEKDKILYSSMYVFSSASAMAARSNYYDLILNWCIIPSFVIIIVHKFHIK